jgi:hypothetical protein
LTPSKDEHSPGPFEPPGGSRGSTRVVSRKFDGTPRRGLDSVGTRCPQPDHQYVNGTPTPSEAKMTWKASELPICARAARR